ncbi:PDDEXK nuclease domain-containing protein [Bacteroides xylanisolvens]|uniref:PDDEXK nuclease domain-containing protein n=1 Tax=Bacteroides xylanisolvens TaxID=371601 RepID=UPI001F33373D|nr:PDDEXK nuclease domain-containing protein [Bacteroides xylanisolvens]
MGKGVSFIGNQYRLVLEDKEYFVDMLFFNRCTRSLIALELKIGSFQPEYVGKMNFYLNLLDRQVKMPDENPSIGIILCADRNNVEVEVALQGSTAPIGVSEYSYLIPQKQIKELINNELSGNKE